MRPATRHFLWPMQGVSGAVLVVLRGDDARTGDGHGRAARPLHRAAPPLHRRLRANLTVALPHATAEQVDGTARAVWGSFGATLAEYAHFETIADRKFAEHVEVVVHPGVEACRGRGQPFIFVTAHLGNWEIAAATARRLGLPLTVIQSPPSSPLTRWLLERRRRVLGCAFRASGDGIRPLLHDLRAGRSIGLVDAQVETGDPLPFCAQHTTTTLVPARLALKFGCPLVPVRVERLRPARFRVTLHDPVLPDAGLSPEAGPGR